MRPLKLLLASKSPRRKELLKRIIPADQIVVCSSNISEYRKQDEPVDAFCMRVAKAKARLVWDRYPGQRAEIAAVIGADTIVLFRQEVIGQPKDDQDAICILKKLSGHGHEVITGVAVFFSSLTRFTTLAVKSKVWMREMGEAAIEDYVATGEPLDKAGAYAIQGVGRKFVERYEGSYTNIMGLPIDELKEILSPLI